MKRFAHFSIGVLCLMLAVAIGYHLGSQTAQAQTSGIVFQWGPYAVDADGSAWWFNPGSYICWTRRPEYDPPVSLSEIKHYGGAVIITHDNIAWMINNDVWQDCGPWPGSQPVPTNNSSWGEIKDRLNTEGD